MSVLDALKGTNIKREDKHGTATYYDAAAATTTFSYIEKT